MPGNFHAVPASVIASWPKPNYVDPVRRSWMPAFSCTLLGVSTVLISTRFYLRARKQAGDFGLDDLFIFIGWIVSVGLTTIAVIDSEWYGIDVHTWDVRFSQYVGAALTGWIAQVLFLTSTCATKISVLLFYRRMVKDSYDRRWLYAIWAALAFTGLYFVSILFAYCFVCIPLDAYWLSYDFSYDKPFACINGDFLSPFVGALSVVSDVYAVLLPCIMLQNYNLNVPRRQKIGLNILFCLGTVVAGCGIARTYYLWKINHTYDTSWTGFSLFVWSLLECHFGVIFACAPSLRALFRRYLEDRIRNTFRSFSSNRSKNNTKASSQNQSTLRNSNALNYDAEANKRPSDVDEKELRKASDEEHPERDVPLTHLSISSRSSDTVPPIKTPEDYEAYAMRQLNRHAHGYKTSNGSESLRYDWEERARSRGGYNV